MNEWMAKRARNRFSSFILCTFALLASICFYLICVPNKFYKARQKKTEGMFKRQHQRHRVERNL